MFWTYPFEFYFFGSMQLSGFCDETKDSGSRNVAPVKARGCASVSLHSKADIPDPQCCGCSTKETVFLVADSKSVTNVLNYDTQV